MLDNRNVVNKWINFCFNQNCSEYPGKFIFDIWGEEKMLSIHIYRKFKDLLYSTNNPVLTIMEFYCYLDHEKQDQLTDWVDKHYE